MNTRVLNGIIIFSVIGLTIIGARDYFFGQNANNKLSTMTTTAAPTPAQKARPRKVKDPDVPCKHSYFNFTKGTKWTYSLKSEITLGDESEIVSKTFVNEVIEVSPSLLIIESKIRGEREATKKEITCKKSGIHGFPYPLIPDEVTDLLKSKTQILGFLNINPQDLLAGGSALFLPPEEYLVIGGKWKSDGFVNMTHTVVGEKEQHVPHIGISNALTINASVDTDSSMIGSLIMGQQNTSKVDANLVEYHIAKRVGVTDLNLDVRIPDAGKIKASLKLVDFTPSPPSSSR